MTYAAKAQPGSTTGGFGDEPEDVPVDGGISILLVAGLAYGAARLRKKKEETTIL